MTPGSQPPWIARLILQALLAPEDREHALGDLEEEFRTLVATHGARRAERWYWSQLWRSLGPSVRRRALGIRAIVPATWQLRHALRALARRRGLVVAATSTLALGVGAATAIFSVAEAALLRPLPFEDGDELVQIWNTYDSWKGHEVLDAFWDNIALSYPEYQDVRARQTTFEEVAIYGGSPLPLVGLGEPREEVIGLASAALFPLLGVEPVLGRTFAADEEGAGAPKITVLAYETWRDLLGSDPDVLGSTITIAGAPYTVVGVLPAGFHLKTVAWLTGPRKLAWVPVGGLGESLSRGSHVYEALGRLPTQADLGVAHEEIATILRGGADPSQRGARLTPRKTEEVGTATEPILVLLAGVGLLLLIACGNFATLLIGEASKRSHELATRYALGAETPTILRQLVLESTLLGLAGGAAGLLIAQAGVTFFLRLAPPELGLPVAVTPNLTVLSFGIGMGVLTGALFGLAPGLSIRRRDLGTQLRGGSTRVTLGRRTVQTAVLAGQMGLSLVLLVCSGLLIRSTDLLEDVEPGFEAAGLWGARVLFSRTLHEEVEARQAYHEILSDLQAMPGITSATLVSALPFSGLGGSSSFDIVGREVPESEKKPEALRRAVYHNYHEVMGIPLVSGRFLDASDNEMDAPAVVVSESLADQYWPDGDPLGARIFRDRREMEIVGVVGDVLHADLSQLAQPTFYVPLDVAEVPFGMSVVVGSELPGGEVSSLLRERVHAVDGTVPVEDFISVQGLVDRSTAQERFRARLMMAFAAAATLLCALGLFAATARIVAARRRDIGIRLALGAKRWRLVGEIAREESVAIVTGVLMGVAGAWFSGRLLAGFLFGVSPVDVPTYTFAVLVLVPTGVLAMVLAARRGAVIDPASALREE